jgi:hypothetical protein
MEAKFFASLINSYKRPQEVIMKNTLLRTGLIFGLALVFGTVGFAQVSNQYKADVPFDFQVGSKTYSAGEYTIKALDSDSNSGALALVNRKTGQQRVLGLTRIGGDSRVEKSTLTFVKVNGTYALGRIHTPTIDMSINGYNRDNRLAQINTASPDIVTVLLTQ